MSRSVNGFDLEPFRPQLASLKKQQYTYNGIRKFVKEVHGQTVSLPQLKRRFEAWNLTNKRTRRNDRSNDRSRGDVRQRRQIMPATNGHNYHPNGHRLHIASSSDDGRFIASNINSTMHTHEGLAENVSIVTGEGLYANDISLPDLLGPMSTISADDAGIEQLLGQIAQHDSFTGHIFPLWRDAQDALLLAATHNDLETVESLLEAGAAVNGDRADGATPLGIAADGGHISIVKTLCEKGANVDSIYVKTGRRPLHQAAQQGHFQIFKILLSYHAQQDMPALNGETPLWLAAENGHGAIVKTLLENPSIDVDARDNKNGRRPLHQACQNSHTAIAKMLIDRGALCDTSAKDGETPLLLASESGDIDTVRLLLSKKVTVDVLTEDLGRSALHQATQEGYHEIVQLLLKADAAPDIADKNGVTPLVLSTIAGHASTAQLLIDHCRRLSDKPGTSSSMLCKAAYLGHLQLVETILDSGIGPDSMDADDDMTALSRAAENNQLPMVRFLASRGADVNARGKSSGRCAMHQAAQEGHLSMVGLLLKLGTKLDTLSSDGCTPLWLASQGGSEEIVQFLLTKGVQVNTRSHHSGRAAIHQAAKNGHSNIVSRLLTYHADPNLEDFEGVTPLWLSARHGDDTTVEQLLQKGACFGSVVLGTGRQAIHQAAQKGNQRIVKMLLDAGAAVDAEDYTKTTSLHLAAMAGDEATAQYLLRKGADPNRRELACGFCPLHLAAGEGHLPIVRLLISHGAEIDPRDDTGLSPLWRAVNGDHETVVQYLLERKSSINILQRGSGVSMLDIAASKGNHEIVQRLLIAGSPVNHTTDEGATALHFAAEEGHGSIVNILCNAQAALDATTKTTKTTPLHQAAAHEHLAAAMSLLSHGASHDIAALDGETPLWYAATTPEQTLVRELLERNANPNVKHQVSLNTPLHNAARQGHKVIVQLLLDENAAIDELSDQGETPLWIACQEGHTDVVELLLSRGASPTTCVTNLARTCLQQAAQNGHLLIVKLLLNSGAPADSHGCLEDMTPLMLAAAKGHVAIVTELISHRADINWRSKQSGRQAIHFAAAYNNIQVLELLLLCSTDTNHKDFDGQTAYGLAQTRGHSIIVRRLLGKPSYPNLPSVQDTSNDHSDKIEDISADTTQSCPPF